MRLSFNWDLDHPIVLVGCELKYHRCHNDITYSNHAEKCFQDGSLMLFTTFLQQRYAVHVELHVSSSFPSASAETK